MKKYIFTWVLTVFALFVICSVFYFLIYNAHIKQAKKEKSIEEIAEDARQFSIAYRKNLEQKILFYKNDPDSAGTLEELYLERGKLCRLDRRYKTAFECFQQALKLAQKSNNKDNMACAAWNLIWIASLQNKTDLVLSLNNKFESIIKSKFGKISIFPDFYYYWVGNAYLKKNDLEKASEYLTQGIKIANEIYPRIVTHYALLLCAFSIVEAQKQDFKKALKRLNKVADSFYDFNYSDYNYKEKKRFLEALEILEKCNPPSSFELSSFYKKVAKKYIAGDNKIKFKEYIFKAIRVLEELKVKKEKIADLYYELGTVEGYAPNKYFDKCLKLLEGIKNSEAANIVYKIAYYGFEPDSKNSLHLLLSSLKMLPESQKKPLWVGRAYHLIAFCYNKKQEWQKSADYAQKSLELIEKDKRIRIRFTLVYDCYNFLDDYYKSRGELAKRIENAQEAIICLKNGKDDILLLNSAYEDLGKIYRTAKRYSDSEKAFINIVEIMKKEPKLRESTGYLKQEINAYCEIGDLCLLQKNKKKAEEAFDAASNLLKRKTVAELAEWYFAKACLNIADGYYYLHKDALAEKYYKKLLVLLLAKSTKDHRAIAYVCHRIGNIALGQKKVKKSQDYFKKGLKFALAAYKKQKNKYGNNLTTGMCAADIGSFYDNLKQKDKALEFLQLAHQLLKKYGESQPELAERISRHIKKIKK